MMLYIENLIETFWSFGSNKILDYSSRTSDRINPEPIYGLPWETDLAASPPLAKSGAPDLNSFICILYESCFHFDNFFCCIIIIKENFE